MNSASITSRSSSEPTKLMSSKVAWLVLSAALIIRIFAVFVWQGMVESPGTHFRFGDSHSYWILARTIANGSTYQFGSPDSQIFRAPLYPLFLSPFTKLASDPSGVDYMSVVSARLAGAFLGTWSVWFLMTISHRLAGIRAALFTGTLAAFYPGAIGMSIFVLSESIVCPLLIASLYFSWQGLNPNEQNKSINLQLFLAGFLSGCACLARPSWSLWPVVLFPFVWLACSIASETIRTGHRWLPVRHVLLYCIGIAIVMSPWWYRNYQITRKFVPTTLQVGASLYDGWHPNASGSSDEDMQFVNEFIAAQRVEDEMLSKQGVEPESTFEWRLDRRMYSASLAWARVNSSAVVRLGLVKFAKTWSPLPTARELGSSVVRWSEAIAYTAIMFTALFGLWILRSQSGTWLFAMPCLYFAILHMFFIGSVRYRQPAVLILCVIAGAGCSAIIQWIVDRRSGATSIATNLPRNASEQIDGSIASNDVIPTERPQ